MNAFAHTLPRIPAWLPRGLAALVASVWLYHGLCNKLLGLEPRHLLIVQSVPGFAGAVGVCILVLTGLAEVLLAVRILAGRAPRLCAAVQTVLLLSMNVVELTWARPHLLSPGGLLPVNLLFLSAAWASAVLLPVQTPRGLLALHPLRRHPVPVRALFRHSLVLTYALPRDVLEPLLPPGLVLDTYGDFGFIAVAMVQARRLRPACLPAWLGRDFFLAGYRVFVRFRPPGPDGRTMRGLFILRSDTDRRLMAAAGNLLTHYNYRLCRAEMREQDGRLSVRVRTPSADADVDVWADLGARPALPAGSPFATEADARRFAGPLPWTFDYEPQTHSIIAIKGVRSGWDPRPVPAHVERLTFFDAEPFRAAAPVLASAFHVHDIPYEWRRGVRFALDANEVSR